jgi:hypothetical protein
LFAFSRVFRSPGTSSSFADVLCLVLGPIKE